MSDDTTVLPAEALALFRKAHEVTPKPMSVQIGGSHYSSMAIQPLTYILANHIPFPEGNVIKYVSRWRNKNGIEDLRKARDMLDKLIAHEEGQPK